MQYYLREILLPLVLFLLVTTVYNDQKTFTIHLDGNVFWSPFGNHHAYNLKLGTGFSLMYVSDTYARGGGWPGIPEKRASLGYNMIVEQELTIAKKYLFGVKAMIQPYLNGDIASSLMLKAGKNCNVRTFAFIASLYTGLHYLFNVTANSRKPLCILSLYFWKGQMPG